MTAEPARARPPSPRSARWGRSARALRSGASASSATCSRSAVHDVPHPAGRRRARSACCTSPTRTWRPGSTASRTGSRRSRIARARPHRQHRRQPRPRRRAPRAPRALRPASRHPGVFVHGSNDHAAPSPRNPFTYFTRSLGRQGDRRAAGHARARRLLHRELGWLDLNNAVGSLDVRGSASTRSASSDAHRGWDRLDALPGPARARLQARRRDPPAVDARRHPRAVPAGARLVRRPRRRHDLRRSHARRPGARARVRRARGQLRHPARARPRASAPGRTRGRTVPLNVSAGLGTRSTRPCGSPAGPRPSLLTLVPRRRSLIRFGARLGIG